MWRRFRSPTSGRSRCTAAAIRAVNPLYIPRNHIVEDVIEVDYQPDIEMEFYIGIFIVIFIGVLMTIISIVVARKHKNEKAAVSTAEPDRELFLLDRSGHVVPVDYDGPALSTAAADFLSRRA